MIFILILIISWAVSFISGFIELIPQINISVLTPTNFRDVFSAIYYFLPMDTIGILFIITVVITNLRLIYSLLLRLKSFIPGISGDG